MSDTATDHHLPLRSVELDILLGVADHPRHGYAILQEAEERAGGNAPFEVPTLYRALRRMRDAGLIRPTEAPAPDLDDRREYWEVTPLGHRVLKAELERLEVLVATGRARIGRARAGGSA